VYSLIERLEVFFQQTQFIDLQFIFIKSNYLPDLLLTNFDIDVSQFSFDGRNLRGTMAGIQAIRTKLIINYCLNNDDRDYPAVGIHIAKYLKYGFSLLTPIHFNFKRFEASPSHITNHDSGLRVEQNNNNEHRSVLQLSDYHYNNNNDYEYRNHKCLT
jgi:hypothetical protein